jgi:hypothetical protein
LPYEKGGVVVGAARLEAGGYGLCLKCRCTLREEDYRRFKLHPICRALPEERLLELSYWARRFGFGFDA